MPSAFSLIEVLVVVALLSVIILGLLAMFTQTQRAFRAGMTQVDVLEAGRAATDLIAREISEMAPGRGLAVNCYQEIPGTFYTPIAYSPLLQRLPGAGNVQRTNVLEYFYFLSRENQTWSGIGYLVDPPNQGVGTLYRFFTAANVSQDPDALFIRYRDSIRINPVPVTNTALFSRIMDGVVHFKVRAYDTNSDWITRDIGTLQNGTNITAIWSTQLPNEIGFYQFTSNAVPAFVELEIGILEDRIYQRYKSIPTPAARRAYLSNHVGQVHLFRQRVPVRNVDTTAYQ